MPELIIIRHARSQYNVRKTTDLDSGLSEWGARQARSVARFLGKHMDVYGFTYYTRPFLRCLQTADPIQKAVGRPFIVMPELREYLNHSRTNVKVEPREKLFPDMIWSQYQQTVDFA